MAATRKPREAPAAAASLAPTHQSGVQKQTLPASTDRCANPAKRPRKRRPRFVL
jgi:hypothetical protein